jgi:hypothetical protein
MATELAAQRTLCQRLVSVVTNLNLYDDEGKMSRVDQILSTRIYVACLITSLFVLLFYTGLSNQTHTVTVSSPSLTNFDKLSSNYPLTLLCPCSQISIPHERFVTFTPQYHQVCSTKFVDEQWIASLFHIRTSNGYPLDYRLFASAHFQVLASLCHTANRSVSDMLKAFATSQMISSQVLSSAAFEIQLATKIDQLKFTKIADVNRLEQIVSSMIDHNHLVSSLRCNFLITGIPEQSTFRSYSVIFPNGSLLTTGDSCFCETTSKCSFPAAFYNWSNPIVPGTALQPSQPPSFIIPGMKVGCTPKDSLFQSTLECLFDNDCLERLVIYTGASFMPSPLNITTQPLSRFNLNATLEMIFQQLMLESLNNVSSFGGYFRTCAPEFCTYSYSQQFSIGYMLAMLIKLVGGLNVMFGTLSPIFVCLIVRNIQRLLGHSTRTEATVTLDRHRSGACIRD